MAVKAIGVAMCLPIHRERERRWVGGKRRGCTYVHTYVSFYFFTLLNFRCFNGRMYSRHVYCDEDVLGMILPDHFVLSIPMLFCQFYISFSLPFVILSLLCLFYSVMNILSHKRIV